MQHVALTIGTTASKVLGPEAGGCLVQADAANTADIYLGGAYVTADATATGGIRLGAGVMLPLLLENNDPLYAIVASGTAVLRVIQASSERTVLLG